jgi:hypothetical protein
MSEETESVEQPIPVLKTVWYKNPTLWVNVVVAAALISATYFGVTMPESLQASIIAIVNIVLQSPKMTSSKAKAIAHNKGVRAKMIK